MTGHMNGHHALQALKPLEVASYLRVQGWRQEADLNGKGSLWLLGPVNGHDEADVTLPLRRDLGDFELRMSEVVRTLSRVEKRPEAEILQDLLTTSSDLIGCARRAARRTPARCRSNRRSPSWSAPVTSSWPPPARPSASAPPTRPANRPRPRITSAVSGWVRPSAAVTS